ncbi:TetR/AcrR family transcriptional regulator [Alkalibacter saccharofermentans]|uniref:Transcriptional regulator, TetR family n=1 Tax=Alkalibacter saccharofermentans DSM 14828 TaxID=1120975 RepID=A0A1M4XPF6_9FIRM|nr:TetR/AcrR family transcriptional regulator [Alkalibacter saccharofermentans]SHE95477.1 transcriptional regulator, TetR family [Alkalibacter saccharofermentans DSM 14828]
MSTANNSTKSFIIDTANKLFLEKNYKEVTIADICEACNISKTTFYYHLKSKEDLILQFYDGITHNISLYLMSIITQNNHWDQLMICFDSLIDVAHKYGSDFFSQMLISNLKKDHGSYELRDELTQIAVAIIKKGQETGQIRNKNNPLDLYVASAYAFLGHEVTWCIKNGNFDWKGSFRHALECIYDAAPEFRK